MTRESPTDSIWSLSFRVKGRTHSGLMYAYQFRHPGGGSVTEGGGGGVLNPYRVRYIRRTAPNTFPATYTAPLDLWQKNPPMPVEPPQGSVGVDEDPTGGTLPSRIALHQNYPNPFNPTTTIRFTVPATVGTGRAGIALAGRHALSLRVFDLLGREVSTLVSEVKEPGTYTVQWDATNFASGVYLYRLEAGGFSQTKKMLLMR
ncbi:MAG: T9SS type A sorting domain-containing protein [Ignavibacteriae bacterium]|nr:T9SS type A sorting domain-containing protein [Ignavibacteriota bacterium]